MKPVRSLGDSLKCLRDFPEDTRQDAGYQLDKVQRGEQPDASSPCLQLARASRRSGYGTTRAPTGFVYSARIADAVYVLHAFQKKAQATSKRDIDTAKEHFAQLMRDRK